MDRKKRGPVQSILVSVEPELYPFLQSSQFHNNSIEGVYLDKEGDLTADLDIVNWVLFPNKSFKRVKTGSVEKQASQDFKVTIDQMRITEVEKLSKHAFSVKVWRWCRQREELMALRKEEIDQTKSLDSYILDSTIWAVARALNSAYISTSKRSMMNRVMNLEASRLKAWQLHSFLQSSQLHNKSIEGIYLDEKGDLTADLDIVNWVLFPNK
ncbi:hypothetical protein E2320_014349 [Naja naja]|nr:hypothetical protein E2320_014349 [Naja naja]